MNSLPDSTLTPEYSSSADDLNACAWAERERDRSVALELATRAAELAHDQGDVQGVAHSLVTRAFIAFRENHYDAALEQAFSALEVLESAPASVWRLRLYNLLGITHFDLGEYATGYDYLEQQRTLSQHLGEHEMEALAQHDIAVFHLAGEMKQQALESAREVFRSLGSTTYEAIALYNLSNHHLSAQNYVQALDYAEQLHHALATETFFDLRIMTLGVQAESYSALQRRDPALAVVQQALALAEAHAPPLRSYCHARMGMVCILLEDEPGAIAAFERSLEVATDNARYLLDVNDLLAESYAKAGEYARAYTHQKNFQHLFSEIHEAERAQKMSAFEVIYKTRRVQREAELERATNTELKSHIAQLEALNAQIRELSIRDSLTGLYNRRYFSEQLAHHFADVTENVTEDVTETGRSLGLILLDIDHFKRVNDTHGHTAGDAVLKQVAHLLLTEVRETDIVSRYGGEEFALLLPQQDLERTLRAAERIRERVESWPWQTLVPLQGVTLSLGVAMSGPCLDTDELLRRADARLYDAKHLGRNRVCFDRF